MVARIAWVVMEYTKSTAVRMQRSINSAASPPGLEGDVYRPDHSKSEDMNYYERTEN